MKRGILRITNWLLVALSLGLGNCYSADKKPDFDRETNWLRVCDSDNDCADTDCICGVCSIRCDKDITCQDKPGTNRCYGSGSSPYTLLCDQCDTGNIKGLCLPACDSDNACQEGFACVAGACMPDTLGVSRVSLQFSEPIHVPAPETKISGDFDKSALLGEWETLSDWSSASQNRYGPLRLVIEETADDVGLQGRLVFPCNHDFYSPWLFCDTELNSKDQTTEIKPSIAPYDWYTMNSSFTLSTVAAGFDYRMFNGIVEGDRFSFWITNRDLWRQWCVEQTPYPYTFEDNNPLRDRIEYRCAIQPEDPPTPDNGEDEEMPGRLWLRS